MNKVKTTRIRKNTKQGGYIEYDYARVPDRLVAFWAEHPNASVKTHFQYTPGGGLAFTAEIVTDKSDPNCREANGHALYTADEMKAVKAFEKLETIATGRALAKLGYLNDGEIATTEEMEEFRMAQAEKKGKQMEQAIFELEQAKTLPELRDTFLKLDRDLKIKLTDLKDELKAKLTTA
nr:MAG TPA: hypothetical protein [Caudoviricetes sp.]